MISSIIGDDWLNREQAILSHAQAVLVIGSTLVSPLKALLSIAQIIDGIFGSIIYILGYVLTGSFDCMNVEFDASRVYLDHSVKQLGSGCLNLPYSVINFFSLGVLGLLVESDGYRAPAFRDQFLTFL